MPLLQMNRHFNLSDQTVLVRTTSVERFILNILSRSQGKNHFTVDDDWCYPEIPPDTSHHGDHVHWFFRLLEPALKQVNEVRPTEEEHLLIVKMFILEKCEFCLLQISRTAFPQPRDVLSSPSKLFSGKEHGKNS